MIQTYHLLDGGQITVASPEEFVRLLREGSRFDYDCTDQEYMENFARRYGELHGVSVATDTPEHFLTDLQAVPPAVRPMVHMISSVFYCPFPLLLSFCPDGSFEFIHRLVFLDDRPVHRRRGQFRIEVRVVVHDHFGAVRRVRVIECDHTVAFLECE